MTPGDSKWLQMSPVSQSVSQSAVWAQSVSQPASQSVSQLTQSVCLSVSQSADAVSVSQSVSQDLSSSLPGSWITHVFCQVLGSSWNLFGGYFASFSCCWSPILPMGFRGVVFSVLGMEIVPGPNA